MQATQRPLGQRLATGFFRLVMTIIVLGLVGLVLYLFADRNARSYGVAVQHGQLVVTRGRMMPTGADPWHPTDPVLADAYAPIPLENLTLDPEFLEQTFTERDELDRALFNVLEKLARPRLASDDPKEIERGAYYVRRMERLTGLSPEQRETRRKMQGELAWYLARIKLEQARELLEDALTELETASTGQSVNSRRARQLAQEIGPVATQFEDSLKRALGSLPPAAPTTAEDPNPNPGVDATPVDETADAGTTAAPTGAELQPPQIPVDAGELGASP